MRKNLYVIAYVANNPTAPADVLELLLPTNRSLTGPAEPESPADLIEPAVSVRASIKPDYLVCLVCGAKHKTLKRHLLAAHQLTPEQYRERYNLRPDYPMVASSYSKARSKMAKDMGLGRR